MSNLDRLYMRHPGFASVVDALAIWFMDETDDVPGAKLSEWLLSDEGGEQPCG